MTFAFVLGGPELRRCILVILLGMVNEGQMVLLSLFYTTYFPMPH